MSQILESYYDAQPIPQGADKDTYYAIKVATGQFFAMDGKVLSGKGLFEVFGK